MKEKPLPKDWIISKLKEIKEKGAPFMDDEGEARFLAERILTPKDVDDAYNIASGIADSSEEMNALLAADGHSGRDAEISKVMGIWLSAVSYGRSLVETFTKYLLQFLSEDQHDEILKAKIATMFQMRTGVEPSDVIPVTSPEKKSEDEKWN